MWVPLKPRLSQKIIEVPGGRQSILGGKQNWDKNLVRNVEVLQMERDTLITRCSGSSTVPTLNLEITRVLFQNYTQR
jgi:hypothetical protein